MIVSMFLIIGVGGVEPAHGMRIPCVRAGPTVGACPLRVMRDAWPPPPLLLLLYNILCQLLINTFRTQPWARDPLVSLLRQVC